MKTYHISLLLLFILLFNNCKQPQLVESKKTSTNIALKTGAERLEKYLPVIKDKDIALVVNQTSRVGEVHLADTLISLGISVKKIFSPEHGFRGTADAGEKVVDGVDEQTGVPIISLYGKNRKPGKDQLADIDWVLFDIQDVGVRFYTYISTMHYVMDACAENNVAFMVLDRPNPNGHYVDGPVLDTAFRSFVGMHPVPVVHGMTLGEYATMVNEEGWLSGGVSCRLKVIPCEGYTHETVYEVPVKPSPNLPNNRAIYLYPSLCFFEGTVVSVGRGTNTQFQVYGHPDFSEGSYTFTPVSMDGAKYPKHEDLSCNGYNLSEIPDSIFQQKRALNLTYLLSFYQSFPDKQNFFLANLFFDKLAGGAVLREQIIAGLPEAAIRESWQPDLTHFKEMRKKYLIYQPLK